MEPKKRSRGASERDEWLRAAWRVLVAAVLDATLLVFVDEMGSNIALAPLYAYTRPKESGPPTVQYPTTEARTLRESRT